MRTNHFNFNNQKTSRLKLIGLVTLGLLNTSLLTGEALGYYADGQNGSNALDQIIIFNKEIHQSITLMGGNGSDGKDGYTGSTGRCDTRDDGSGETFNFDVPGGKGGRGGHGGQGGNGGNLTVIYERLEELNSLFVNLSAGSGGLPGRGGQGGFGCPDGKRGASGTKGKSGKVGSLFLVPSIYLPYEETQSIYQTSLGELMPEKTFIQNNWISFQGSRNIVAANSILNDRYFVLKDRKNMKIQVYLDPIAKIDSSIIEKDQFELNFTHSEPSINLNSNNHMAIYRQENKSANTTSFTIERLYRKNDFNSIYYKSFSRENGSPKIFFSTATNLIPMPQLDLSLTVEVRGRFRRFFTIYNGVVSKSYISQQGNQYSINLNDLPLDQKISSGATLRLSFQYSLKEKSLQSLQKQEVWIVR